MNLIHTTTLTPSQKKDIMDLVAACRREEPLTLSAPSEDGLEYFLYYEGSALLSMLFLFFPEETACECGAFTLPSARRNGYFLVLLDKAMEFMEFYEDTYDLEVDFCFISDDQTPSAAAVLQAVGAGYRYSEYSMERDLSPEDLAYDGLLTIHDAKDHLYTASLDGVTVGVCMTIPSGESVYFYGFEIKENFRRKGLGTDFLLGMIKLLARDYKKMTLQVSGRNLSALSLYEKTGFRITETLSYYLY